MQVKEGGKAEVEEVVAVTMGPDNAQSARCTRRSRSAPTARSSSPTTPWPARTCCATGYALGQGARVGVARPGPARPAVGRRRVLHDRRRRGRPPEDALAHPGHQDGRRRRARCAASARPSTATTPSRSTLPAVISVGDAINEPRYPSLKAIMGAKKKPLDNKAIGDVGIEADRVGGRARARPSRGSTRRPPSRPARSSRTRTPTRPSRRSSPGSTKGSCSHERDPHLRPPLRERRQQELAGRRVRGGQAGQADRRRGARGGRRRRAT